MQRRFSLSEDGAVTIDWVVLTAAAVGIAVAGISTVAGSSKTTSCNVSAAVEKAADYDGTGGGGTC
ncbi:hypothetical protein [Palleronia abyssalis]|uniref:Uncharacterized protein n=1 Tax=Palleronia abyssalis TaxID=1501240 RepID=A0A2R8BV56_9RHOB|nr:hypothetical protein [Palleronia abyssalis]SPJ23995.1 hypothetical protein PAA8504_01817 [Palleronia abyssalis]